MSMFVPGMRCPLCEKTMCAEDDVVSFDSLKKISILSSAICRLLSVYAVDEQIEICKAESMGGNE